MRRRRRVRVRLKGNRNGAPRDLASSLHGATFVAPAPTASPAEEGKEGLARLSIAEVSRAFHGREDLERLSLVVRRAFGQLAPYPPDEPWASPAGEGVSPGVDRPSPPPPRPERDGEGSRLGTFTRMVLGIAHRRARREEPPIAADALERLLEGPERDIDVARGALLVAREDEPGLDVGRALDRIDRLAEGLRAKLADTPPDPWERLAAANEFIFDDESFKAEAVLHPGRRLDDLHLARVIERRRGHCLGLSVLYLALAERAGLPLFGVSCPRHFFVRYDDGSGTRVNLETTLRGASAPDSYYVERYRLSPAAVDAGLYLGNLAKKQVLVELLHNRANCYWDMGDAARASRDLDRVARASRSFAPGFFARGFLAFQRGEAQTAVSELRRAIEIDPTFARAYLHLADALLKAGSPDSAEVELGRLLAIDPRSALAHTNLGRVHARRGDLHAAIGAHLKALGLDRECHVAWNNLGVTLRQAGDEKGARAAFHKALAIAPRFLAARENLAIIQKKTHHRLRAALTVRRVVNAYREKLARSPDDEGLHAALARFLGEVGGDPALARRHAEQACRLAPDSPRACEVLAQVEKRAGNLPRAVGLLEVAVALAPSRAGADEARLRALLESWRIELGPR